MPKTTSLLPFERARLTSACLFPGPSGTNLPAKPTLDHKNRRLRLQHSRDRRRNVGQRFQTLLELRSRSESKRKAILVAKRPPKDDINHEYAVSQFTSRGGIVFYEGFNCAGNERRRKRAKLLFRFDN